MNYADLFRVTLPETALEIAALLVLVVDLGYLAQGRAADCAWLWRRCWAWSDAARRLWRCRLQAPGGLQLSRRRSAAACGWRIHGRGAGRHSGADGADAACC